MFCNARDKVTKLFDDYSIIASETKYKTIHGERIKELTSKQMFPRLPIALLQVEAGNKSENLINTIRKFVYSLHLGKETTKKVYKNITNSMQL